jgi:Riboflavin kinase.
LRETFAEKAKGGIFELLREEKNSPSKDELIRQIERDIAIVKEKFGR